MGWGRAGLLKSEAPAGLLIAEALQVSFWSEIEALDRPSSWAGILVTKAPTQEKPLKKFAIRCSDSIHLYIEIS
jgi:hypothetical protein